MNIMNLKEFMEFYKDKRNADQVMVACSNGINCVNPKQPNIEISKGAVIKNFRKHNEQEFICRDCDMHYNNPMTKVGQGKRSADKLDEEINVICPFPDCPIKIRPMKVSSYTGSLDQEPYIQTCGHCAQKGKVISQEQRDAISKALSGKPLSEEHKQKILEFRKNNPEWAEQAKKNLIPGMGGIARKGLPLPDEWKEAISEGTKGKKKTLEHRYHISLGRKKMLEETGGFTQEHRENISKAVTELRMNGFRPESFHRKGWHYSTKMNKKVYYSSSYEKKAYLILDEDDSIESYEYEAHSINYWHPIKDINSNYIIDLKINYKDGKILFVEIKPFTYLEDENQSEQAIIDRAKIMAAFDQIENYEVWHEIHLFGLIDPERKIKEFVAWLDQQPEQREKRNERD